MIEHDKILYLQTFKNSKIHSINRAYWFKIIKKYTSSKYENDWCKFFSCRKGEFNDCDAPMISYYNVELNKCIRIVQYDPDLYERKYTFRQWMTAWISKIIIDGNEVPELTVYTLLTHNNSYTAERLIDYWINDKHIELNALIQRIYDEQKE